MKIIAILLMLFGILLILGLGLLYFFGFIMSFDAPGSIESAKAWGFRLLMFLPILVLFVALIFAMHAFGTGKYVRSMRIGLIFCVAAIGLVLFVFTSSRNTMKNYNEGMRQEAEDALLYPKQKFLRPVEGGTDTIIVFPSRIVAYRKYRGTAFPWAGPLGDLNAGRDTLIYFRSTDTKIQIEELSEFVDDQGRKFTDVYSVR